MQVHSVCSGDSRIQLYEKLPVTTGYIFLCRDIISACLKPNIGIPVPQIVSKIRVLENIPDLIDRVLLEVFK